jgi:hypothetical protein
VSTWVNVARYHLIRPVPYVALPWGILAFTFVVNLIIFAVIPASASHARYTGALASIYIFSCIIGATVISRSLPFGLALGVTRRSYYSGTAILAVTQAAVYGLALALLNVIEKVTGGWGVNMYFFRVPYILAGRWYLTWLTSMVGLALLFVYGMWIGLVYRRWNLIGLAVFIAAQTTVLLVAALIATWAHAWPGTGRFFTSLTAAGLTGMLALLAAALLAGGYVTIRRATV